MRRLLSNSWWTIVLRGVAALAFGILALAWPGATLLFLLALFAAYALVSGAASIIGALSNRDQPGWWLVLALGLASIAAGVVAIVYPGITALLLVLVIGINAIVSGLLDVAMAVRLRKEMQGEWLLALTGLLSIVFGGFVILFPGAGALALLWLIAVYAMAIGVLLIVLGLRVRDGSQSGQHPPRGATTA